MRKFFDAALVIALVAVCVIVAWNELTGRPQCEPVHQTKWVNV